MKAAATGAAALAALIALAPAVALPAFASTAAPSATQSTTDAAATPRAVTARASLRQPSIRQPSLHSRYSDNRYSDSRARTSAPSSLAAYRNQEAPFERLVQVPAVLVGNHPASPSVISMHRGKHMTRGYRGGATARARSACRTCMPCSTNCCSGAPRRWCS